jgi:hypothetical protein
MMAKATPNDALPRRRFVENEIPSTAMITAAPAKMGSTAEAHRRAGM